jgi:hypothetical protein
MNMSHFTFNLVHETGTVPVTLHVNSLEALMSLVAGCRVRESEPFLLTEISASYVHPIITFGCRDGQIWHYVTMPGAEPVILNYNVGC